MAPREGGKRAGILARQRQLVLVAVGTFVLALAVTGITRPHPAAQRTPRRKPRSVELQHYGEMGTMQETDLKTDILGGLATLNSPDNPFGPTWHVEEMLDVLVEVDMTGLAAKMRRRLQMGLERHEKKKSMVAKKQPEAQGLLPLRVMQRSGNASASGAPDKMIVVARADEDVSFLSLYFPDIPHTVYQAGWTPDKLLTWVGPEPAFKAAPQAKETNVYLQYIVSHYDKLPETMVFIHAHRHSWHMRDVVGILKRLRWGEIGYANLRHRGYTDWDCGSSWEEIFPCGWEGSILTPRDPWTNVFKAQPRAYTSGLVSHNTKLYWKRFFEEELGPLPELVYTQCCAEFVVHRDRVLARPKEFYERVLAMVNKEDAAMYHELALAFEYGWHMIFGEPPVLVAMPECDMLVCDGKAL